jgi:predicted nucleic acid-binding protein
VIVLDTNVLSELTRHVPDAAVLAWLDSLPVSEVATTAVTAAELLYGVARLPDGRRKRELSEAVHGLINDDLQGRIEPFDVLAADHYARVVTAREQRGRPITVADAQVAAICLDHDAALATRNTADFDGTGIDLVDPWNTDP